MNPAEAARVLSKAAAYDQRTIGLADAAAWAEALADIDQQDALHAVARHYATTTERLMPVHVRTIASELARHRAGQQRQARLAQLSSPDGAPLAITTAPARPVRDRSAEVTALVHQVAASLPQPDTHARARERARNERGRPSPKLRQPPRKDRDKRKKPKDLAPVDEATAKFVHRYLLDGHDPNEVADRLAVSRRWCQAAARRLGVTPELVAEEHAEQLHNRLHPAA